jgi:hypothetical protein
VSERTLRRCITLYGILASTHMVNQVYSAYYKLLKTISAKAWEPSKETLQDLQGAQAQTNAYRFPTRVMSHEPPPLHLETNGRSEESDKTPGVSFNNGTVLQSYSNRPCS